jgi:hypothetical protein
MVLFQQQIGASLDDTYTVSGGATENHPTDVDAMFGHYYTSTKSGTINYYYNSFLRFLLDIPVGSTINSAYLTLHASESRIDDFIAKINYTNEDDAADFSTDPTGRADATTDVAWAVPDFTACQNVQTVDITSLIQHFLNRAGYNANNHIAIKIKRGDAYLEWQRFYQWDYNPAYAAILIVNYTPPGVPPAGYQFSNGLVCVQVK